MLDAQMDPQILGFASSAIFAAFAAWASVGALTTWGVNRVSVGASIFFGAFAVYCFAGLVHFAIGLGWLVVG